MHTRRPLIIVAIVGLLGALLFTGTAAADDTPDRQATPTQAPAATPTPEPTPSTVLVCNLWDGTPYDYWKVESMSAADADWWVANAANAKIVSSASDCPGNAPVSICHVYDDGHKLVSVDPWTANWYLANSPGDFVPANGTCAKAEPTPEPTVEPEPEPTTEPEPEPEATKQPEPEPTTQPTPEPTTQPTPGVTPSGGVDNSGGSSGGTTTTTAVQGVAQERQELAVTGVESWHLALAGLTMLAAGIIVNTLRRRVDPVEVAAHARR